MTARFPRFDLTPAEEEKEEEAAMEERETKPKKKKKERATNGNQTRESAYPAACALFMGGALRGLGCFPKAAVAEDRAPVGPSSSC